MPQTEDAGTFGERLRSSAGPYQCRSRKKASPTRANRRIRNPHEERGFPAVRWMHIFWQASRNNTNFSPSKTPECLRLNRYRAFYCFEPLKQRAIFSLFGRSIIPFSRIIAEICFASVTSKEGLYTETPGNSTPEPKIPVISSAFLASIGISRPELRLKSTVLEGAAM